MICGAVRRRLVANRLKTRGVSPFMIEYSLSMKSCCWVLSACLPRSQRLPCILYWTLACQRGAAVCCCSWSLLRYFSCASMGFPRKSDKTVVLDRVLCGVAASGSVLDNGWAASGSSQDASQRHLNAGVLFPVVRCGCRCSWATRIAALTASGVLLVGADWLGGHRIDCC